MDLLDPAGVDPLSLNQTTPDPFVDPSMQDIGHPVYTDTWPDKYRSGLDRVDQAALDPDTFWKDQSPDLFKFDPDPKRAQARIAVSSYLHLQNGGQPIPGGEAGERNFLTMIATRKGWDIPDGDEIAAFGKIREEAQSRKDQQEILNDLAKEAKLAETLRAAGDDDGTRTFQTWRQNVMEKPGYDALRDSDLLQRWRSYRGDMKADLAPYQKPLAEVWSAMKKGDLGNTVSNAYFELPDNQRQQFMASLSLLAKALPAEQQATFWSNLKKQAGRDIGSNNRNAWEEFKASTINLSVGFSGDPGLIAQGQMERAARNFESDVRRIQERDYDPIKYLSSENTWARSLESGAYGIPGAVYTSAVAAVPYVGAPVTFLSMQGMAYEDMRHRLMDRGVSDSQASALATDMAPIIALPQAALEKLQAEAIIGKMPFFEKALTSLSNRIQSRVLRFGTRAFFGGLEETAIERSQDMIPAVVQDLGHALQQDIPDVQWTGPGGELGGFWDQSASTFVTVFPLVLFGAAGGISRDARARAFSQADPTTLAAAGFTSESIDNIAKGAAAGQASLNEAVDHAMKTRDANSPEAKAAVATLVSEVEKQRRALDNIAFPRISLLQDGTFSVIDRASGEEVGRATTSADALSIATQHTAGLDEFNQHEVTQLTAQLDSLLAAQKIDPNATFEFSPTERVTEAQKATESPQAEADILEAQKARELLTGETSDFAGAVLGASATEFKDGIRSTLNKILGGSSVLTTFHEMAHGKLEAAFQSGRLTPEETIGHIRKVEAATGLRFLPKEAADITPRGMREAVSELLEMEILRTRNGKSVVQVPQGLVSRGLSAQARAATVDAPGSKWASFRNAVRTFWGQAMSRAIQFNKALREKKIDQTEHDTFLSKLLGLDEQDAHNRAAAEQTAEMLGQDFTEPDYIAPLKGEAFSIGNGPQIFQNPALSKAASDFDDYEPTNLNQRDAEALAAASERFGGRTLIPLRSADLGASARDFQNRTGLAVIPFRCDPQGQRGTGGFVSPTHPGVVYLHADCPAPVGTILAHEWAHAAAKDERNSESLKKFSDKLDSLLIPEQKAELESLLSKVYPAEEIQAEILGNTLADALSPASVFGSESMVSDWPAVQEAARELWNSAATLEVSGLKEAPNESLSIGPAAMADAVKLDAISRIKNPLRRAQAMARISRSAENARLQYERLELASGNKRLRKSLLREAATREALRVEELEAQAYARHWQIFSDEDLVKIKSQPVHAALASPDSPLRGRLMSKSKAIEKHPDLFQIHRAGDYDGADGISRSVFGGTLMPDQAAQELYDQGLIPHPTPDAMWNALRGEQSSVAGMKEALAKAQEDIRAARTQAKQETNAWLAEQTGNQEANYSPKQEILRTLAVLDGILGAVPAEIRGKIGGYTQLARLGSDETRLAFLKDRLAKVDTELEGWLKAQYHKEFLAILKRAAPLKAEAGQKPRGKIGADLHSFFQSVEAAMSYTPIQAEAEALKLEKLAEDENATAADRAHAELEAGMIRLVADWPRADAARRESAVLEAQRILERGYYERQFQLSQRRERLALTRDALQAATKSEGKREQRRTRAKKDEGTKVGRFKTIAKSFESFEQVVQSIFGRNTPEAERLADWERHASNAYTDAVHNANSAIEDLFDTLAGGKFKGEALRARMANPDAITVTDSRGEKHTFSELEAITATLMWAQEDGRRHMLGHQDDNGNFRGEWHYDQAFMDRLEAKLSDNAKAVRLHIAEVYAAEYDRLNAIYRDLYGVNLPRHKFYAPLTVKPVQAAAGQVQDPVSGFGMSSGGLTPGSLRSRSLDAIAEPDFRDALQVFIAHTKQMEHWMAYAPFAQEAQALLNQRGIGNSIEASAGKESLLTLRKWLDYFAQGGNKDAQAGLAMSNLLNRMTSRAASAALVGRASVLAIQSVQLGAALAEMPTGAYLGRFAKLMTGKLNWWWGENSSLKSDYIQRRLKEMPPVVRQAMEGLKGSQPNRLKFAMRKLGETISGADALFTAGTYAIIYDYQLSKAKALGMSGQEAAEYARNAAERSTDRVAQPVRPGARSLYEATSTNPASRILWSFASEARQKLGLTAFAMAHGTAGEKARAIAVTWLVGGVITSIMRAAMRDLRDDDDDEIFDERNWDPVRLALSSFTGPLQGIPVLGDIAEGVVYGVFHEYLPEGNLLSGPINAARSAKHVPKWFTGERDLDDGIRDAENILTGFAPVSDNAAAVASFAHILRDLYGVIDNATGD